MKKRTAFIGAILSFIPFGQPLLINTSAVLSTTGLMLSVSKRVKAESIDKDLNQDIAKVYFEYGVKDANSKNFIKAINYFTKAIELDSNYVDAYYERGVSNFYLKFYLKAIVDFTKAIEINPNNGWYYFSRGWAKKILKDKSACIDAKKAIDLGYIDPLNLDWVKRNCR